MSDFKTEVKFQPGTLVHFTARIKLAINWPSDGNIGIVLPGEASMSNRNLVLVDQEIWDLGTWEIRSWYNPQTQTWIDL